MHCRWTMKRCRKQNASFELCRCQYQSNTFTSGPAVAIPEFNLSYQVLLKMSQIQEHILQANKIYCENFGSLGQLESIPKMRCAILTCMDARIDVAKIAGLAEGDAHVIRNAGGRASDDAIRSLVVSHKMLFTKEWFVIQHTQCGMKKINDEVMGNLFAKSLDPVTYKDGEWYDPQIHPGSEEGRKINWLSIDNYEECVRADVQRIRNHPLVSPAVSIYGYIYDVSTGKLNKVEGAESLGTN